MNQRLATTLLKGVCVTGFRCVYIIKSRPPVFRLCPKGLDFRSIVEVLSYTGTEKVEESDRSKEECALGKGGRSFGR